MSSPEAQRRYGAVVQQLRATPPELHAVASPCTSERHQLAMDTEVLLPPAATRRTNKTQVVSAISVLRSTRSTLDEQDPTAEVERTACNNPGQNKIIRVLEYVFLLDAIQRFN